MKKRLHGIETGEIIVSHPSAETTVLIDDMQENNGIRREVHAAGFTNLQHRH
jgi:hypothetical protein